MASQAIYRQTYKRLHFFLFSFLQQSGRELQPRFRDICGFGQRCGSQNWITSVGVVKARLGASHPTVSGAQGNKPHLRSPPPLKNAAHTTKATVKFYPEV